MGRRLIVLLGLILISGMLMGMSSVRVEHPALAEKESMEETEPTSVGDAEDGLSVREVSVPENGHGIYNGREQVSFVISVDDNVVQADDSGKVSVSCIATDHLGYQKREDWSLKGNESVSYHPDLSLLADGEIQFYFFVSGEGEDTIRQKTFVLKKDSQRPVITGRLETSGHRNDAYYSDSCRVYLFVQDDNFDFSWQPSVDAEGTGEYVFSGWQKNGNMIEGVLTFTDEDTYHVVFACTDLAGNQSETLVVPTFIIDRTAPVISVTYDAQKARNDKYYLKSRKALITVAEKWFRPQDGKVMVTSDGHESEMNISDWKKTADGYQAEIIFEEEGIQALSVKWKDPAGNEANVYHSGAFVIDKTAPTVKIENMTNYSSNSGKVAPVLSIADTNISEGDIHILLKEMTGKKIDMPKVHEERTSDNEVRVAFDDFGETMDGIYKLSVEAVDLAGNQTEEAIFFTVNRHGSDYTFSHETEAMFKKVFIQKPGKVVIYEQNVDWLTESNVILSCNGNLRELQKGKDYTVQAAGSNEARKEYTYIIDEKCFEQEGTYLFYVDSKDKAANLSSIDQKGEKAGFILDRTAPTIRMINLEEQQYYHEPSHNFQVTVDDNISLSSVSYYLNGQLESKFTEEEIEEMEGLIELQTGTSEEYQTIQLIAEDKAGNVADSGEWHVLVNTTERTRKQKAGEDKDDIYQPVKEKSSRHRQIKSLCLAGIICMIFIGGSTGYRYYYRKKVSIRRLPDTDDRRSNRR